MLAQTDDQSKDKPSAPKPPDPRPTDPSPDEEVIRRTLPAPKPKERPDAEH